MRQCHGIFPREAKELRQDQISCRVYSHISDEGFCLLTSQRMFIHADCEQKVLKTSFRFHICSGKRTATIFEFSTEKGFKLIGVQISKSRITSS